MYRSSYVPTPIEIALILGSIGAAWLSLQVYFAVMAKRHPEVDGVEDGAAAAVGIGFLALAYGLVSAAGDGLSTGYLASAVIGAVLLVVAPLLALRK